MIEITQCPPEIYNQVYAEIQAGLNKFYEWQLKQLNK